MSRSSWCHASVLILFLALGGCAAADLEPDAAIDAPARVTAVASPGAPLSPAGTRALASLSRAMSFHDVHVGITGAISGEVAPFRVLLAEPGARAAFETLSRSSRPAARLYGLSGLYFTDVAHFADHAARVAASGGTVDRMSGCQLGTEPVAELVRSTDRQRDGTPRMLLTPGTTLGDWHRAHRGGFYCDIGGGCIPLRLAGGDAVAAAAPW